MKKRMLRIMTAATIMGGLLLNANVPNLKAEEYPEVIVFDDVPVDYWAYEYIIDVAYNKVMLGYGNGKFGVGDNVTREQVAAVLYRALNIKHEEQSHNPYKDISERSTMFPKEILALTEHGIFKGDEKGSFRPRETITRAEVAQVLTRAFSFEVKKKHTFTDVPNNYWAKNAISALQSNNVIIGTGNGKFEPNKFVTREQYAAFLYKAIINFHLKDEKY